MYDDDEEFKEDVKETALLFAWIVLPILVLTTFAWFASSQGTFMCNDNSSFSYSMRDAQLSTNEKLFDILTKLSSIIAANEIHPDSEQFIFGVEVSMKVIQGAISGNMDKYLGSIDDPDQIPLF